MKLNAADVFRLYGGRVFILPGGPDKQEEVTPPPEEPLHEPVEAPLSPAQANAPEPVPEPEPEAVVSEPIPEAPTPPAPEAKPDWQQGEEVVWKMKAQAKIALVMSDSDFKNRALTIGLKDCVLRAGIDTSLVGFGILPASAPPADFRSQPVPFSLVFSTVFDASEPIDLGEGREMRGQPPVAEVVLSAEKQEALVQSLLTLAKQL